MISSGQIATGSGALPGCKYWRAARKSSSEKLPEVIGIRRWNFSKVVNFHGHEFSKTRGLLPYVSLLSQVVKQLH